MILVLFGIWLLGWILVFYFSRKIQPISDEITTNNDGEKNDENDEKNNESDDENSESDEENEENSESDEENNENSENSQSDEENSESKSDENDSEYIGHISETEDEEIEGKAPKEQQEENSKKVERKPKFYEDPITGRRFSRKWIASQIPYTKGNHLWLVSRKDLLHGDKKKDSIEVVRNVNTKTVTIRYWNNNRIHGPELVFIGPKKTLVVSLFKKGKLYDVDSDVERFDLVHQAELLYNFYCSSSSYVKNLNLESYFGSL